MTIQIISEPNKGYNDFEALNGVTLINAKSGTHEQNPYDGIQVGVNLLDGLPELVEGKSLTKKDVINNEGEVILDGNYVLSDRLLTNSDKALKEKYKIGNDKTYAAAFRGSNVLQEAQERPNDWISRNALTGLKLDFINSQEAYRAKRELTKAARAFNSLTPEQQFLLMADASALLLVPGELNVNDIEFGKGGGIHIKKENRGKFTASAKRAGMGVQEFARHVLANKEDYSSTLVKRANFARVFGGRHYNCGGHLHADGTPIDYLTTPVVGITIPKTPVITYNEMENLNNLIAKDKIKEVEGENGFNWSQLARLAPAATQLIQMAALRKPNYRNLLAAERAMANVQPVATQPVNKYYSAYDPFSMSYAANLIGLQTAALRSLAKESTANRAALLAGALAANYLGLLAIGNTLMQAHALNLAQRQQLQSYLSGVDAQNAQLGLNAAIRNQAQQLAYALLLGASGALKDALYNLYIASMNNLTLGIGSIVGDAAKEALMRTMIENNPYLLYGIYGNYKNS